MRGVLALYDAGKYDLDYYGLGVIEKASLSLVGYAPTLQGTRKLAYYDEGRYDFDYYGLGECGPASLGLTGYPPSVGYVPKLARYDEGRYDIDYYAGDYFYIEVPTGSVAFLGRTPLPVGTHAEPIIRIPIQGRYDGVKQPWFCYRGEDVRLIVSMTPPSSIAGWEVKLMVRKAYNSPTAVMDVNGWILDAAAGIFEVIVPRYLTNITPGAYVYDIVRTDLGFYDVLATGTLTIKQGVLTP